MSPPLPFLPSSEQSEEEEAGRAAANGDLPQGSIDGKQIKWAPVGRDLSICGVVGSDTGSDDCTASQIPACNEPPREREEGDLPACLGCCLPSPYAPISIHTALIFPPNEFSCYLSPSVKCCSLQQNFSCRCPWEEERVHEAQTAHAQGPSWTVAWGGFALGRL